MPFLWPEFDFSSPANTAFQELEFLNGEKQTITGENAEAMSSPRRHWPPHLAGHEFLDAARNDTTWRKARETFLKRAVGLTFGLLTEF